MIERHDRGDHTLVIDRTGRIPRAYRVPKGQSVTTKAKNFAKAATKHVATGRKKATQEQVDERFAVCETCEYLIDDKMECSECGCGIKSVKGPLSKLTWATSSCPKGKWSSLCRSS